MKIIEKISDLYISLTGVRGVYYTSNRLQQGDPPKILKYGDVANINIKIKLF